MVREIRDIKRMENKNMNDGIVRKIGKILSERKGKGEKKGKDLGKLEKLVKIVRNEKNGDEVVEKDFK